jgi:hypothetical protein
VGITKVVVLVRVLVVVVAAAAAAVVEDILIEVEGTNPLLLKGVEE